MSAGLIQIVPYLPPRISGVGDYSTLLANELLRLKQVRSRFIVCDPSWRGPKDLDSISTARLEQRSAENLARLLDEAADENAAVLLHYVGYAYEKRGCPFWLAKGLRSWRAARPQRRLATMFHELYAFGPVWRSSFWTSWLQRWITRNLAQTSDHCFTNRRNSAHFLERMAPRHSNNIPVWPVLSNFGEPVNAAPLEKRAPQAVLFGNFGRSIQDREEGWSRISNACRSVGAQSLVAIGCDPGPFRPAELSLTVRDKVSQSEARAILSESRIGFLDYFDGYLAKSSIFAAYASFGLLPVLLAPNHSELDGLQADREFLVAPSLDRAVPLPAQQQIADKARQWYGTHNLTRTAGAFAAALFPNDATADSDTDSQVVLPAKTELRATTC